MITLIKGMDIPEFPELELLSKSGDYDENDLVLTTKKGEQEWFSYLEAQYVKYGNKAYDENNIPT